MTAIPRSAEGWTHVRNDALDLYEIRSGERLVATVPIGSNRAEIEANRRALHLIVNAPALLGAINLWLDAKTEKSLDLVREAAGKAGGH